MATATDSGTVQQPAHGMSDYEIAALWGVTRSRVWQLRQRAMKKLRQAIVEDAELREVAEEVCGHPINERKRDG